jgi:DNA replication protein DnaC
MSVAQVKNFMSELKLTGMSNIFEETVKDATENSWTHSEFLDVLLQSESDWREERKIKIRIKNSKLKMNSSFEDFDFTTNRSITKAQIKEIYTLKWIEQSRPLLLIGQTGVGKTFIAQAVGLHACEKGKLVLFMTVTTWMENLARRINIG